MKQILSELQWIEDQLPPEITAVPRYGGWAYYLENRLVMILVEHRTGIREHKGVAYPFELWRGCILPIEKFKQNAFFLKLPLLENHPANKNWLYIPAESENFEDEVKVFIREIAKRNPLLGIAMKFKGPPSVPVPKKSAAPKKVKADKKRENALFMSMLKIKK
jgi:hypothetical protein